MNTQNQAERLANQFTDRILRDGQSGVLQDFSDQKYPDIFVALAKTQATKLFEENSPLQFSASQRYLLETPELAEQIAGCKEMIIQATIFDRQEIYAIAQHAFHMQLALLARPRQTLLRWLYKKVPVQSKQAVSIVLEGFDRRRRLIDEWLGKIGASEVESFEKEELERLCATLEKQLFEHRPVSTTLSEITAYLQFESAVLGTAVKQVQSDVLLLLLRERGIDLIYDMFSIEAEKKALWSLAEIENALGRLLLIGNIEVDLTTANPVVPRRILGTQTHQLRRRRAPEGKRAELEKRQVSFFDKHRDREVTEDTDLQLEAEHPDTPDYDVPKEKVQAVRKMQLNEEDRSLLNSLFGRDEEQYQAFIDHVKRAPNWDTAKAAIEKEMSEREISPYSKEALQLGDMIFIRYFTSE